MWKIQKFEKFFFVVAFSSVVSSEKKIMSFAEEEREGEGSNEPKLIRYVDFSIVQVGQKLINLNQAVRISVI